MSTSRVHELLGDPYAEVEWANSTQWYYASINGSPARRVCFVHGRVRVARAGTPDSAGADFGPPNTICNG